MMDGISAMDTGNNGQMLQMNLDAIQEVKVLTQGYQAEFGRSSGLQISAVTKSGSNRFHGTLYEIAQRTSWNALPWANKMNGTARSNIDNDVAGYTFGGPVGRPGGNNKLFFFYSHEYRPTNSGGGTRRFRLPTDAEIAGDFRQSTNQNGALITLKAPYAAGIVPTNANCGSAAKPMPCVNILTQWRNAVGVRPNVPQSQVIAEKLNYNYETIDPESTNLLQQPAIRLDYQMNPSLRITGKYAGQRQSVKIFPASMPGFNENFQKYPMIHNFSTTANYTLNPTTFLEATWGMIQNRLGAPPITEFSNRLNPTLGFQNFPLIYPDAGIMDSRYYEKSVLVGINTPFFDAASNRMNLMPNFQWGNLVSNAPPNITFPGFLNINRTNDVSVSLTKVVNRHTLKTGFYLNHSYKAQNTGAGGGSAQAFQGIVNFEQDNSNPLDTGFGYANALLGVFRTYTQSSRFVEGNFVYNNIEMYLQDNWRLNSRFTLDYGLRIVNQQPQYDKYMQASNWFLGTAPDGSEGWNLADAPQLYVAGCSVATIPCPTNSIQARNPATGALLGAGTGFAIGTLVDGTGNKSNGVRQAGDGTSKYNYIWRKLVYAPRVGAAYDLFGAQEVVVRGSYGLFFDRPDGNSVFSQVGNYPFTETPELRWSTLADVAAGSGSGVRTVGVPQLVTFEYENPIQKSHQWNMGAQISLPFASSLDVSYVGQRSVDRLERFDLNSVDFGTAFLPQNQDPTKAAAVDGTSANVLPLLRPYRGISNINQNTGRQWRNFHSIQASFQRRFTHGLAFGANYTLTLSDVQSIAPRLEHFTDSAGVIRYRERADQAKAQDMFGDQGPNTHILRANFVWDLPNYDRADTTLQKVLGKLANGWQLSGVLASTSGTPYSLGYQYNISDAGDRNRIVTGSQSYGGRIVLLPGADLGSGCSKDQFSQFNNSVVKVGTGIVSTIARAPTGPSVIPAAFQTFYGIASDGPSDGLESGDNYLKGCASNILDLSLQRTIELGGGRNIQFRLDAFNALNTLVYTGRNSTLQINSPTNPTIRNNTSTFIEDPASPGTYVRDTTRDKPQDAGFGAANAAAALRTMQAQIRFQF